MSGRILLTVAFLSAAVPAPAQQPLPAVKVLSFTSIQAAPERQELVNALSAVAGIDSPEIDRSAGTLSVRGVPEQLATAEWLFRQLDQPSGAGSGSVTYPIRPGADLQARVIFLAPSAAPQGLQEIAYAVRVIGDVQPVLPFTSRKALVLSGTAAQGDLSEWLAQQLDQPPGGGNTQNQHWYGAPNTGDHLVRVFYLDGAATPEQMQLAFDRVRVNAGITRIAVAAAPRAIVIRGTAEQVAAAEKVIQAREAAPVR